MFWTTWTSPQETALPRLSVIIAPHGPSVELPAAGGEDSRRGRERPSVLLRPVQGAGHHLPAMRPGAALLW